MTASLITFVLLGCMLLWLRAWQRGSKLATGVVIGAVLALGAAFVVRAIGAADPMPVWLPALPFALIATTLFAFGLLAWFWGDKQPHRTHESGRPDQPESMTVE
jgi:hypothetical protein